jgi:hypothetical protein
MPMWAAVAAVAAAYSLRSIVRGGDFRPDLPIDAILLAVLGVLVAARVLIARWTDEETRVPDSGGTDAPHAVKPGDRVAP